MCQYCINFLISDPNESFVVFFMLFHNVFFHCYAAIASPAMRGQSGKYQQFIICFFLVECIKLSTAHVFVSERCVVPRSLFLSPTLG